MSAENQPSRSLWLAVLSQFDLGEILNIETGGGTAAPKIIVETDKGRYIIRRRREAHSVPDVVAFDHSVICALASANLPTIAPEKSKRGETWVYYEDLAYEAFRFIGGLSAFTPGNRDQVVAAARTLAKIHIITAKTQPSGAKPWPREHMASVMAGTLSETLTFLPSEDKERVAVAAYMLDSTSRLTQTLTESAIAALPQVIGHGDYTPANIMFRGNEVAGVFDFDWVSRQSRCIDIGEGIMFFAFRRATPIDPDSIWSLIQTWEPDWQMAEVFLRAYQEVWPLTASEADYQPLFMRETWLGSRIRAMRKVPSEQKLSILTDGALLPLQWLEENTAEIAALIRRTGVG